MKQVTKEPKIVKELTPELADKIYKSVCKAQYDQKVAKEHVLFHLKQLKAQMGKLKSKNGDPTKEDVWNTAISWCQGTIDKKIKKIAE